MRALIFWQKNKQAVARMPKFIPFLLQQQKDPTDAPNKKNTTGILHLVYNKNESVYWQAGAFIKPNFPQRIQATRKKWRFVSVFIYLTKKNTNGISIAKTSRSTNRLTHLIEPNFRQRIHASQKKLERVLCICCYPKLLPLVFFNMH